MQCSSNTDPGEPAGEEPRRAEPRLFAMVLAAGAARRFGAVKQLATYRGAPLVTRAIRLAERLCGARSLLVAGHEWRAVTNACRPLAGFFVRAEAYERGMGTSIAAGVRCLDGAADGVLLLLVDQPLVTDAHLQALLRCWRGSPDNPVATAYADRLGPPVIFPARCFPQLCALEGDRGARSVLESAGTAVSAIPFKDAAVDIDRPGDLDSLS